MPELSIVIVTFNSSEFIMPCLDSIFNNQDYKYFEVILIDNGSTDNTVSLVKSNYPQVRLITNKENQGASKARNQGIEVSGGRWVLTLDCDVYLEKDFLNRLMTLAEKREESIGLFQPKILRADKKTIYSCGIYLSKLLSRFYDIGQDKVDSQKFNTQKYIFGACSAAALYRTKMLEDLKEKTGYFDERFFFLVEDVDLAWRAYKKGYKTVYVPEAVCYHSGNSSNTNLKFRQYLCFRNRYYTIMKNERFKNIPKIILSIFIYELPRLFYIFLTNRYALTNFKRDLSL